MGSKPASWIEVKPLEMAFLTVMEKRLSRSISVRAGFFTKSWALSMNTPLIIIAVSPTKGWKDMYLPIGSFDGSRTITPPSTVSGRGNIDCMTEEDTQRAWPSLLCSTTERPRTTGSFSKATCTQDGFEKQVQKLVIAYSGWPLFHRPWGMIPSPSLFSNEVKGCENLWHFNWLTSMYLDISFFTSGCDNMNFLTTATQPGCITGSVSWSVY